MIMFGFGGGATMPLCLSLSLDFESQPAAVGELTGWMPGFGYLIAATGPALRDLTGGFVAAFGVVAALALADTVALPRHRRA